MEHLREIIERHAGRPDRLLVALQEIQDRAGYVPPEAIPPLAKALDVPEGEVYGVISFYTELRTAPPGKHHVRVCRGDSCAALGAYYIAEAVEAHTGAAPGNTTRDGRFTHDAVYCLGNCALSPSVCIDGEVYGRCTPESVSEHLRELEEPARV